MDCERAFRLEDCRRDGRMMPAIDDLIAWSGTGHDAGERG